MSAKYCIVIYIPPSCADDFLASSLSRVQSIFKFAVGMCACKFEMGELVFEYYLNCSRLILRSVENLAVRETKRERGRQSVQRVLYTKIV